MRLHFLPKKVPLAVAFAAACAYLAVRLWTWFQHPRPWPTLAPLVLLAVITAMIGFQLARPSRDLT